ncbi:RrF2 family transcriptional regulator [Candidatus Latescibacterota bacterium]
MLKLSNKGLYGVKALYVLARNYGNAPINIKEISRRQGLPVSFLEQVLHQLKTEGIVTSHRGVNGGYVLSDSPDKITIGDIIRALEGPIALCDCLLKADENPESEKEAHCVTSSLYKKLGKKVEEAFDSVTLSELADESIDDIYAGTC